MRRARFRKENDPRYKKFGAWVRELRRQMKMSQTEFAARVGVNYLTIRRWELGWGHFPQPKHMKTLNQIAANCTEMKKLNIEFEK
jgi:DNA-binding transcriptional regulator YiaG